MGKLDGRAIIVKGGGKRTWAAYSIVAVAEGARLCVSDEVEQPSDLAGTVNFLLSADSDFMTGQTLVLDGGGVVH